MGQLDKKANFRRRDAHGGAHERLETVAGDFVLGEAKWRERGVYGVSQQATLARPAAGNRKRPPPELEAALAQLDGYRASPGRRNLGNIEPLGKSHPGKAQPTTRIYQRIRWTYFFAEKKLYSPSV